MAQFTLKKYVEAPPEKVFQLLTDFKNLAQVVDAIQKVEVLTEGTVGVGTKFKETRVMFKKESTEQMEVTSFDPPHGFTLGCDSCGARFETVHKIISKGEGAEIELTFSATPTHFIAKLMAFMTKFMLKSCMKAVEEDLENIKVALESP